MATVPQKAPRRDRATSQVIRALGEYGKRHPSARVDVYRRNVASIRARIIDPDFEGIGRAERHEAIWSYLEALPEDLQSQVGLLVLLTPEEAKTSVASFEFDNPTPSKL
jgi:hypothetical protein